MKKTCLIFCLVLLLVAGLYLMPHEKEHCKQTELVLHTVVTLQAEGPEAKAAVREGMERLRALESMIDEESEDSDTAKLRAAAGKEYVSLRPEVYHMLELSQQYSEKTNGAWDITLSPLLALWEFDTEHAHIPSHEDMIAARQKTGWQHLKLRAEDQSALLDEPGMSIHLGGIAKGYAADEVRRIFRQHGVENGLINIGASSICAMGKNTQGSAWKIGLRHPRQDEGYCTTVELSNASLSTSGDYERFFLQDGKRYHHILDSRTGMPADSDLASVTIVIDGNCEDAGMLSDLLSTTIFILGKEKGRELISSLPEPVSIILVHQDLSMETISNK